MRAVLYDAFAAEPTVIEVSDPTPRPDGVVLQVEATGLCRSDWHAWQGHDPDIVLPHVPGHELAGRIAAVGAEVRGWRVGDPVAVPFICACGRCSQCRTGQQQVCLEQQQPGFNYWGSFAEYVSIPFAEVNLIALPEQVGFDTAAALGCRFATSYRAVTAVGQVRPAEWVVVFGCGGVGLSAVMIAAAAGARVIAVDTEPAALALAAEHGASHTLLTGAGPVDAQLRELTGGGADVTIDAIGAAAVVQSALSSLRPRGRHVQIGLLPEPITVDLSFLAFRELAWLGSHGMAAHAFGPLLDLVGAGALRPDQLITRTIALDAAPDALVSMGRGGSAGVTIIHPQQSG
ncbi:MAG TPA: alcohol dehydrogenase catalytic domain-containing protein [Jatrophihabitans sp.]|nr:alcohol dehydrogenase catalytic domain-containing protein [Jatrophihabitans sp.]